MAQMLFVILVLSPFLEIVHGQFCDAACETRIREAEDYTNAVNDQLSAVNDQQTKKIIHLESQWNNSFPSLLYRVADLEYYLEGNITSVRNKIAEEIGYVYQDIDKILGRLNALELQQGNGGVDSLFVQRVANLENHLRGNVSVLQTRIADEVTSIWRDLTDSISKVQNDLNKRINDIVNKPGGGGGNGNAMEVYFNLTYRIDNLEFGKIQNLTDDNNMWRKNFRIVNATFDRLKKSKNCIC